MTRGQIEEAFDDAISWMCDAEPGTDQHERGTRLKKAVADLKAATWQACIVQGALGFDAGTKPETVIHRVNDLVTHYHKE